MSNILTTLRTPAIISSILVLPFMILEWVNRRGLHEHYPIVLFGLLWLLPMTFMLLLAPLIRNIRVEDRRMAQPIGLVLRVAVLILIALLWGGLMRDQMPCFLGVPNCD